MKRTFPLMAVMFGSILLPLLTGLSLAQEGGFASTDSHESASQQAARTVRMTASRRRTINTAKKTVKITPKTSVTVSAPSFKTTTTSQAQPTPQPPYNPWIADVVQAAPAPAPVPMPTPAYVAPKTGPRAVEQAPMTDRHRELARMILGTLPASCQDKLQSFTVIYDNPKHRGLAGRGVIILSGNVPDQEFIGLLVHEGLGHFAELTCLEGTPAAGASPFTDGPVQMWKDDPSVWFYSISWSDSDSRHQSARDQDFVSGYAKTDPFEDLAETVAYYMLNEEAFSERAQTNAALSAKLAWMRANYPKNGAPPFTGAPWNGQIPWDATRVSYSMN